MSLLHLNPPVAHIQIMQAELESNLYRSGLKVPSVTERYQTADRVKQRRGRDERILEIANEVITKVRRTTMPMYSNYYSWERLRKIETKDAAREAAEAMRRTTWPFGNCLWMNDACATALKAAVRADPNRVRELEKRIQIATDNWFQNPRSSREYHCYAMINLSECSIVLDPVAHHAAIKIPFGQITQLPNTNYMYTYITVGTTRVLVDYHAKDSEKGYSVLQHPQSTGKFNYSDPFTPVVGGFAGGIANLAWPTDSYYGKIPSRRIIFVRQPWDGIGPIPDPAFVHVDSIKRELSPSHIYTE